MALYMEPVTRQSQYWDEINALAREAFPPEEYLAPSQLVEMTKGNVDFWALSDQGRFVGFMVILTHQNLVYLFFLAIHPALRSKGYGSRSIQLLKNRYPDKKLVVDFERPDARAENSEQRKRRRDFYRRNGYKETGLLVSYRGVEYEVFCMEDDFHPDEFQEMMKTIRVDGFHPTYSYKPV